ncbi:hypothetical protein FACS1894109_14480 [Spirochaetia bacterium]|nr:hypothetical protein FACS1894109_14480 [Spirochaetia bacterium]
MRPLVFAGILFILVSCASAPEIPILEPLIESPFWEKILEEIPWEGPNRMVGSIEEDENKLPPEVFGVMVGYGYRYVNSTHKIRQEDGIEIDYSIYEIKREGASYDPSDDTFMFIGEFYPDEANIWLIFSKDKDYPLFAEPDELNKKEYRFIRVSGTAE